MSLLRSDIIKDSTAAQSGWQPNKLDMNSLQAIKSGLSLNAIPTPFARAEVVKQAFEEVCKTSFDLAGFAYRQLVSDTLDILEILFNYPLYRDVIQISKCNISQLVFPETNAINDKNGIKMLSLLHEALDEFRMTDEVYLVSYNDGEHSYALALSSPETLFFTTGRLDRQNNGQTNEYGLSVMRKDAFGKAFFTEPRSLADRNKRFRDFLFHIKERDGLGDTVFGRFISKEFGGNKVDLFNEETVIPLKDNNGMPVILPYNETKGISFFYNNLPQAASLIRDQIINIGYNINTDKFTTISNRPDCLLPIDMNAFAKVEDRTIIDKVVLGGLKLKAGEYEKPVEETKPKDIPSFDLGIYPTFRYPKEYIMEEIATYHIVLACQFEYSLRQDAIGLRFYSENGSEIEELKTYTRDDLLPNTPKGVIREIRTEETTAGLNLRTIHYTVFGTNIDYIQVDFKTTDVEASGVLKPKFKRIDQNHEQIKFAIDFGTTSTYIAAKMGDGAPTALQTQEESMAFLHGNHIANNTSAIHKYEQYQTGNNSSEREKRISDLVKIIKNEFIPSSIDGQTYKFPIRTAVSYRPIGKPEDIFEDANIAFTYGREPQIGTNEFKTNIKWDFEENLVTSLYIREIIRICMIHAIREGYQKSNIEFLYFYPLAMNGDTRITINNAWKNELEKFDLKEDRVSCMTESMAPYYAINHDDATRVVSIDIGGGSVDAVIFADGKAQFALSALFGCDVLWGGGRNTASNDKSNPIYKLLKPDMDRMVSEPQELHKIHTAMTAASSKSSSVEIINFWLSNNAVFKVSNKLQLSKYHPVYIGHFYALLYHIAQIMKIRNVDIPREISLSGNGSLYLNNIKSYLSKIASAAFKDVYGEDATISVILPENNNGKEMTALGGLALKSQHIDQTDISKNHVIYLGEEIKDADPKCINKRDRIISSGTLNEELVQSICRNVVEMEKNLSNLFNRLGLNVHDFKSSPDEHRTALKEIAERTKLYIGKDKIESTLFFIPLRQMIFKLADTLRQNS